MYVRRGRREGEWMRGLGLASPILWEQGECWTCVSVWVAWCGWCKWAVGRGLDLGLEGWCGQMYV